MLAWQDFKCTIIRLFHLGNFQPWGNGKGHMSPTCQYCPLLTFLLSGDGHAATDLFSGERSTASISQSTAKHCAIHCFIYKNTWFFLMNSEKSPRIQGVIWLGILNPASNWLTQTISSSSILILALRGVMVIKTRGCLLFMTYDQFLSTELRHFWGTTCHQIY